MHGLLLEAPEGDSLKSVRDRAILATLLFHALRRHELCDLNVEDFTLRNGITHLTIHGKGGKIRYVPVHPQATRLIEDYLEMAGHGADWAGPLFRPVRNNRTGTLLKPLHPNSVYQTIVLHYGKKAGIGFPGYRTHSMRSTAATNALEHGADIQEVREWLGHSDVSTTQLYDKRKHRTENSPSFKVRY